MGIIARHVLVEFLKVLAASLLVFSLVVTLGLGLREGLRQGLPPHVTLATLGYILPESLGITMPVGVLLAACTVFSRMAGANELLALKAQGIHPLRVLSPVLALAVVLSLATVCIYEAAAAWGRPGAQRVVFDEMESITYSVLRTQRGFAGRGFAIGVKGVDGPTLISPTITYRDREEGRAVTLSAEEAQLAFSRDGLTFRCRNGEIELDGRVRLAFAGTHDYTVELPPPVRPLHRDWLSSSEIPAAIAALRSKAERIESRLEGKARYDLESLHAQQARLAEVQWQIDRLRTEPSRRWANGFSCLGFVVVGVPVAMRMGQRSFLSSFFACFLPILALYYPLLMLQEDLTCSGVVHPWGFWMANAVVIAAGAWLLRGALRH